MSALLEPVEALGPARLNELRRIAGEHGGILRAEDVVAEAAVPDSPLHDAFTWDDTEAAQKYRLVQARQLIRVTVQYLNVKGQNKAIRVFVSLSPDREEEGGGYREVRAVLADSSFRAQLLADALREMQAFEAKYNSLAELAEIFETAKVVQKKLHKQKGMDR